MFKKLFMVAAMLGLMTAIVPSAVMAAKGTNHHLVIQVNANDPALMNLALNNAVQSKAAYTKAGMSLEVEVVAYGPGLKMLTADSPVAARIQNIAADNAGISFAACGNTMKKMAKKSGKPVELLAFGNVKMVPAGVVHIMQRQDQGWHYIKP